MPYSVTSRLRHSIPANSGLRRLGGARTHSGMSGGRRMTGGGLVAALCLVVASVASGTAAATPTAQTAATDPSPVTIADLGVHLEDIPSTASAYQSALNGAVTLAIANQQSGGSFEVAGKINDVGDNSLGVSSLLALEFQQSSGTNTSLVTPFLNSISWFLANRVYTTDDVGDLNFLAVKNSGKPYAKYTPSVTATVPDKNENGDWPTTDWALLDVGNILQYGDGLLTAADRTSLINLGLGYWSWLTSSAKFDPQGADNQAIASVLGALQLSAQMKRLGMTTQAATLSTAAMKVYTAQIQPLEETDRGYTFYPEHAAGFDQNYGAITLTFLTRAWNLTKVKTFYNDGLAMATYLNERLSARGFDYGGPRHEEDHPGFEAAYGLCSYSNALGDDLGRYLGNASIPYTSVTNHVTDGHFAFAAVWEMGSPCAWNTTSAPVNNAYKMRSAATSVVLSSTGSPYLVTAGGDDVLDAAAKGTQSIGLAYGSSTAPTFLTQLSGSSITKKNSTVDGTTVKIVKEVFQGAAGAKVSTETAYILDGTAVRVITLFNTTNVASTTTFSYVAGLPYLTTDPQPGPAPDAQQEKILSLQGIAGGSTLSFGTDGGTLADSAGVLAGPMSITSPSGVTVTNPTTAALNDFSDSATLGLTLEQYSASLNGGNEILGWQSTQQTNLLQAPATKVTSSTKNLQTTQVTYGPSGVAATTAMTQATTAVLATLLASPPAAS